VFLVVDFLLLLLALVLLFDLGFVFDLVAFFVVGPISRLVALIGPGGEEGSVGSVDSVDIFYD
jgi:hypothetical protein